MSEVAEPWVVASARCDGCGHEWVAARPLVMDGRLQCPECREHLGRDNVARWPADAEPIAIGPPCSPPCDDDNCTPCAVAECPTGDVLHRHGDGCPSCAPPGDEDDTEIAVTRRDGQP